jgi:hypothetical protein
MTGTLMEGTRVDQRILSISTWEYKGPGLQNGIPVD